MVACGTGTLSRSSSRAGRRAETSRSCSVYRGLHFQGEPPVARAASFISATFSPEVAGANSTVGGPVPGGVRLQQVLPVERVFMSFVETRALNDRFREAEVVLLGSSGWAAA